MSSLVHLNPMLCWLAEHPYLSIHAAEFQCPAADWELPLPEVCTATWAFVVCLANVELCWQLILLSDPTCDRVLVCMRC